MNKKEIIRIFTDIDRVLTEPAELVIYGSAAFILLDEDERMSLDIDVAGPYSAIHYDVFCKAVQQAGLEVNPDVTTNAEHIEWVSALRLCLAPPDRQTEIVLWQGQNMVVKTVAPEDLVASKLIRYDPIDEGDVRFLVTQMKIAKKDVLEAVERLPRTFRHDVIVRENLKTLIEDMALWTSLD